MKRRAINTYMKMKAHRIDLQFKMLFPINLETQEFQEVCVACLKEKFYHGARIFILLSMRTTTFALLSCARDCIYFLKIGTFLQIAVIDDQHQINTAFFSDTLDIQLPACIEPKSCKYFYNKRDVTKNISLRSHMNKCFQFYGKRNV